MTAKLPKKMDILGFKFRIIISPELPKKGRKTVRMGEFNIPERKIWINSYTSMDEWMPILFHEVGEVIIALNWANCTRFGHTKYDAFMNMFYDTIHKAGLI